MKLKVVFWKQNWNLGILYLVENLPPIIAFQKVNLNLEIIIYKRVFIQRYIRQCGELQAEPFCMDLQLLNEINKILKNMEW